MIRTPMLTGDMNLVSVTGCSGAVRASRTGYGTRPWCSAIWGRASTRTFAGTRGSHAPLASAQALVLGGFSRGRQCPRPRARHPSPFSHGTHDSRTHDALDAFYRHSRAHGSKWGNSIASNFA